jgi:hypothetical protein
MSTSIRQVPGAAGAQAIATLNQLRRDMIVLKAGLVFHAEQVPAALVTTATATDQATTNALLNALKVAYNAHIASICDATSGQGAHIVSGGTALATANAVDLATSIALANAIKAAYNTHVALTTAHASADAVNTTTAPTATDLPTTITMANEMKGDINAHIAGAFTSQATVITAA